MPKVIKITMGETPWVIASKLINAKYNGKNFLGTDCEFHMFDKADLRRIGEHLVNYARVEGKEDG